MKKCADITNINFYLQGMGQPARKSAFSPKVKKQKSFKILVQDDVKNSLYLIDA